MNLLGVEAATRDRLGLDPAALGSAVFRRAVERRMRATGVATPDAYLGVLAADPVEAGALVDELVVPETWFFRGGRTLFDRLAGFVAGRPAGRPARVLCVPCSTGEEPYSLAIALRERLVRPESYTIDAFDISRSHLARATAARFTAFAFREAGPDIRPAYFRRVGDQWELLAPVRAAVRFGHGNATDLGFLDGEPPYDLILCRNLFIYLTPDARRQAMATFERLLAADGRLCLTPGEADRLPPGRFTSDGPAELGIYRRADDAERPAAVRAGSVSDGASHSPPLVGEAPLPRSTARRGKSASRPEPVPATPVSVAAARQLADAGRLAEARAACEQLTHAGHDLPAVYTLLGVILQAQGHAAEAADAFRKALYLDPDHAEALGHMIVICDRRGDAAQAAALRKRLARATREGRS